MYKLISYHLKQKFWFYLKNTKSYKQFSKIIHKNFFSNFKSSQSKPFY